MVHQKRTVFAVSCILFFVSLSAVFAPAIDTAYAQSPESITPTITLMTSPCPDDGSDPDCLIATNTTLLFKISFSPPINRTTFTLSDVEAEVGGIDAEPQLSDEFSFFKLHIIHVLDGIIKVKVPAGVASDALGNTNKAAEITIRLDLHSPIMTIPDSYLSGYGKYIQYVKVNQTYIAPVFTCVDEVYEGDSIVDTVHIDAVPETTVNTNLNLADLPAFVLVKYVCLDESGLSNSKYLEVVVVEDLDVINTPPTLLRIERGSPLTENTDSMVLSYNVFFSKIVVGVDKTDFVLSPDSTGRGTNATHPATDVSLVSGDTYTVTISAATSGTYNLDLVSSGHGIVDVPNHPLSNTIPTGVDESYNVTTTTPPVIDSTAPTLASIERYDPASQTTDSLTLVYKATFSESVTGVDTSDFALSFTSTGEGSGGASPVTAISGSGSVYYVTVSASSDGTYNIDLASSGHGIADTADNPLTNTATTSGTDHTYTVDTGVTDSTAPTLASIERHNPASQTTDSLTLVYKATFSESVTGVDTSDFALSPDSAGGEGNNGTSAVTGISGSGSVYYVTVTVSADGTYNIDLASSGHGIADTADNPLTNTATTSGTDHTYTVDTGVTDSTAPTLASIERHNPASQTTDSLTLVYKATFSESVTGVDTSDFALSPDSAGGEGNNGTSAVTGISGSGSVYYVTVTVSADGTYNIDLASSGHGIADTADNPLTNTAPTSGTDHTYTVDTDVTDSTAPTLASIERYDPAFQTTDSQTLVYKATFSESVTGVDTSDFVLSPDSTGGSITTITTTTTITSATDTVSGQFMQTQSPDLAIPDQQTVSDAITIPDSGTATSVSVAVDIEHGFISDLFVELIAPDGTSRTLHDYEGGDTDNINQTYTPSFGSVQIAGNWILQINDIYDGYPGILDSWTLAINYTAPATTVVSATTDVSPITGVSGSGSVYYVTVSSAKDGTYNIDLAPSDHGIADIADNPLTDAIPASGTDHTYAVNPPAADDTAPTLESIKRYVPTDKKTDNRTLVYLVTFNEDVTGVDKTDFLLSSDSTGGGNNGTSPITHVSGSGSVYYVIVTASQDGTYNIDLASSDHGIADTADNPLTDTVPTSGTDHAYAVSTAIIDDTSPMLESIRRYVPTTEDTNNLTLVYLVTFNEDVTGVDVSDFVLSPDSTGGGNNGASPVTGISGSGNVYYVTVFAFADGTYNIDLVPSDHGIADTADNPLTDTVPTGGTDHTYTVSTALTDKTAPTLESIQRHVPIAENTYGQTLIYRATFSEDVTGVDRDDFVLSPDSTGGTGNGTSSVTGITGHGRVYNVIVAVSQDGTYNLDLMSSGHGIADTASHPLTDTVPTTGTDQTYTVSADLTFTAPTLTSIERYSPASGNTNTQTLIYKVTFSEDVAGVDDADFALSPDSTGGNATTTATTTVTDTVSGQFTQTHSPSLAISHVATASDAITVPDSGAAVSVSVAVDIEHDFIGDLFVELIAPDGTSRTLHDYEGGTLNAINQTYTPSFWGAQITGNWTLQINDDYHTGFGVLNSWTLAINHTSGSTTTTITTTTTADVSPVTDVSGFGSVYYATIAASKDGTYNIDLIPSDHGITDTSDNPLTDAVPTSGTDQTYTFNAAVIDGTAPTLLSIERYDPASQTTDSQTLIYKAIFSENMTGVDVSDFVLSSSGIGGGGGGGGNNGPSTVTGISGSGSVYYVTVFASTQGTYNLDLASSGHGIADAANNPLTDTIPTTGTDQTYTVTDDTAPTFLSIERHNPAVQNTYSQMLTYKATFSENVTGVDTSDFVLSSAGTEGGGGGNNGPSTVTGISGSGSVYYVTVFASTQGTYNLDLASSGHGIADTASNPLANTVPATGTDQTYTVTMGPKLESIQRYVPIEANTSSRTLIFVVYFSEAVTGVDESDFVLSPDSTGGGYNGANPIVDTAGSRKAYSLIVTSYYDGTYNLDLILSGHGIVDVDGNPLVNAVPTTGIDHTYTVDGDD